VAGAVVRVLRRAPVALIHRAQQAVGVVGGHNGEVRGRVRSRCLVALGVVLEAQRGGAVGAGLLGQPTIRSVAVAVAAGRRRAGAGRGRGRVGEAGLQPTLVVVVTAQPAAARAQRMYMKLLGVSAVAASSGQRAAQPELSGERIPPGNAWTNVSDAPFAGAMAGAILGSDGRIYALTTSGIMAAYSSASDSWQTLPSVPGGSAPSTVLGMSGVRLASGATEVMVLDQYCNTTSPGEYCVVKSYVYPT
jgi:hypothetical protein